VAITTSITIISFFMSTPHYGNLLSTRSKYENVSVIVCGGGSVLPITNHNIIYAKSCNEAYTNLESVHWLVDITDSRIGDVDLGNYFVDGYCKNDPLESWGIVAGGLQQHLDNAHAAVEHADGSKKRVICDHNTSNAPEEPVPVLDIACNNYRPPEYHTFVLWDPSLWLSQEKFLYDSPLVEVEDTFVVTENHTQWCLSIYGNAQNARGHGNCHVDGKNPKVVVVKDPNPLYGEWKTPGARQVLNKNIYGLKTQMRNDANIGYKSVHSSNNVEETLLVLKPLNRHKKYGPSPRTFDTIQDVFQVMNQCKCLSYVVMRSHEEIAATISKDVDILVNDYFMWKVITGAQSNDPKQMREVDNGPHIQNIIDGRWIFDVRYVGDGYYDTTWQLDMLQRRVMTSDGIWIQEPLSYTMSLLYHYNVHKKPKTVQVPPPRWEVIHHQLPLVKDVRSLRSRTALQTYMTSHGYAQSKPHDTKVAFHQFESLQTTPVEVESGRCVQNWGVEYCNAKTPFGEVIVKEEPKSWSVKCGKKEVFPKFCDRPYGEWIASEASNYLNISGVGISVARWISIKKKKETDPTLHSLQLMFPSLRQEGSYEPSLSNAIERVHIGVLDYIVDNCDRFGNANHNDWKNLTFTSTRGNPHNWREDESTGALVMFDNGKSMGCHGTSSLAGAHVSVRSFWNGWCAFPPGLHVSGVSAFLFEQMGLPNSYIGDDAMRGLQWREKALLEYISSCLPII